MTTRKNNSTSIVFTFLEFINVVKLYHWNTHSYAEHIATDELYISLSKHIDKFVEVMLGSKRIPNIKKKITLINTTHAPFVKKVNEFKQFLLKLNMNPELMNIRDDILTDVDQFIYLLSQK
jgi:hypothetical protein